MRVRKGRQSAVVQPSDVKALREKYSKVNTAWTIDAFDDLFAPTGN
jgi:hypothetical protein